jgi:hypothetical protein
MIEIKPLFDAPDEAWVWMVGKYMLNMGAIELTTRLIVVQITGSESDLNYSSELSLRIGFIKNRFPRHPIERHAWAMNVFKVGKKHADFRNIIAHGGLVMTVNQDGRMHIHGIMALTPKDRQNVGHLVSLEELTGRVDESAALGRQFMEMQADFTPEADG